MKILEAMQESEKPLYDVDELCNALAWNGWCENLENVIAEYPSDWQERLDVILDPELDVISVANQKMIIELAITSGAKTAWDIQNALAVKLGHEPIERAKCGECEQWYTDAEPCGCAN